ncbi:MAG TPA: inositol monophosphatase family protein, partial [Holophagaceae bacterium]|nr:inositol monophosphatase family protein [Holophagaceae bacterium]
MPEPELSAAVEAARAGGEVLLKYFRRLEPGQISEKTRNDLVSVADRESEAAIRAILDARFPAYAFLGEETGASG